VRIYISCDMEGISGLVHWDETGKEGQSDYERFRRLMTQEVNAAALGAFDGGATGVTVNDSHGGMRNIIIEDLDPRVRLVSGSPKAFGMMQGVDGGFDAAFFVGYHSRACSLGVLNHTYSGYVVAYRVNGVVGGETAMNAFLAGEFDVPVVLVTGDDKVCDEVTELLGPVQTVAVKRAAGRYAADCLHPAEARRMIREAAQRAVAAGVAAVRPLQATRPVRVELAFHVSAMADAAMLMPGVERVNDTTVALEAPDYAVAFRGARAMISLARP
jgi:D-amino peptidase